MPRAPKIVWNDRGFRDLLKHRKTDAKLLAEAKKLAQAAGPGHEADLSRDTPTRSRARVWTNTREAVRAEATDRRLSRAAFARAIGRTPR